MRIFLSYHARDEALASRLLDAMHEHAEQPSHIFRAPEGLRPGAFWQDSLAAEVHAADAFVLLIADHGVGSWQIPEYYEAFDRRIKTGRPRIIPVLKSGQNLPGLPFLAQIHRVVASDPASPECVQRILAALHAPEDFKSQHPWRYTRPYSGLAAMSEADSNFFFGRDQEIRAVLRAMINRDGRFPLLIGNSGVGKTSIVQAGVFAALKRQVWPGDTNRDTWPGALHDSRHWAILSVRPGSAPLQSLVAAFWSLWRFSSVDPDRETLQHKWFERLMSGSASLKGLMDATRERLTEQGESPPSTFLLYLDQAEELYARAEPEQARRFASILVDGLRDPRLCALASLRSDFYGHLQLDTALRNVWQLIDVLALGRDAILDVITQPARELGVTFAEHDLPRELARQTQAHPGYLPLLSYLLDGMWTAMQTRGDGLLIPSVGAVNVGGVLAATGERYTHAYPGKVPLLQRLFTLRLVHLDDHGEPMRRRASRGELTADEWELATELAEHPWRLLVTGRDDTEEAEPYAEVGHEALLREWGQLRVWLIGDHGQRSFLIWKTHVERLRRRYEQVDAVDRNTALLFGYDLEQARFWKNHRALDISAADIAYIDASIEADAAQQRRVLQHLREARATQSRFLSDLAQQRLAQHKIGEALALALEALPLDIADWPIVNEAECALFSAVHAHSTAFVRPVATLVGHSGTVKHAAYAPDGRRVLTWSYDGTARIWDAATGTLLHILSHDEYLVGAVVSKAGDRVLTWSGDKTARLWSIETGKQLANFPHDGEVRGARLCGNDAALLTWSIDGTARLWDAETGSERALFKHAHWVLGAVLSKDESRVLTWSFDGTAQLWNVEDGRSLALFRHEATVSGARFNDDESAILTYSADNTVGMWDVTIASQLLMVRHEQPVLGVIVSKDQRSLLTWSADGTARVWEIPAGKEVCALRHDTTWPVLGAVFSRDERRVLTWSSDRTARLWNMPDGALIAKMDHAAFVEGAMFSSDESKVLAWCRDGTAHLWSVTDGPKELLILRHGSRVRGVFFLENGQWIWTRSDDGSARLWSVPTWFDVSRPVTASAVLQHDAEVQSIVSSPTDDSILTASADGTATIWDIGAARRNTLLQQEVKLTGAWFLASSAHVLSWSEDGALSLWSVAGERLAQVALGAPLKTAVLSPSTNRLATLSEGGSVRIWDPNRLEALLTLSCEGASGVAFCASGKVVGIHCGKYVNLYEADSGTSLGTLSHSQNVMGVHFSAATEAVLTWDQEGCAYLWRREESEPFATLRHKGEVLGAEFSADGERVLTFSKDFTARMWNARSGDQLALMSHDGAVLGAKWSHDETEILTYSRDGTARLWSAAAASERVRFRHSEQVTHASHSTDRRRVLTCTSEGATLWDIARGDRLATFPYGSASGADLSPDMTCLLTWARGQKVVALWRVRSSLRELVDYARGITEYLRPLSKVDRCRAYLDTDGCSELGGATERDLAVAGDTFSRVTATRGVGNLADFVSGGMKKGHLDIEVAVKAGGVVMLFHSLPLDGLTHCRFHRLTSGLEFVRGDGESRSMGLPLSDGVAIHMERADRILTVLMDPQTGEQEVGPWLPVAVY